VKKTTNWLGAVWEASVDFVIDLCTMVPAAFIGVGLVWNDGKNVMTYIALGLPFLAIAFFVRAMRYKTK
jgi:ABC-type Fe3+ transport system permease subunit